MSLLVPRFKFLMRLSKEILKLNRIRQRYISNIGFLNFTANQTPSMVNWWGFCWRSGIQHRFNISSFDPPFFEPRMNFSTKTMTRWWFQIFFVFTPTWKRFPIWLIFFKGVATTNKMTSNKALQLHWSRCFWWSLGNFHVEVGGGESSMVSGKSLCFLWNLIKCDHPTPVCAEGNVGLSFIIVKILVKHLFFGNTSVDFWVLQHFWHAPLATGIWSCIGIPKISINLASLTGRKASVVIRFDGWRVSP